MQKKFVTNLAFLIVINLLVKPFWILAVDRGVQNHVGAEDYGLYFALFNFSFLFHIVLDFGVNNFNNIRIAKEPELLEKHVSNILVMKGLLALVYAAITFAIGWWLSFSSFQMYLLQFMVLNQILLSVVLFLRSNLAGLHYFRTDAVLSVMDRLLLIIIVGSMLWGLVPQEYLTIEIFVYAHTAALTMAALTALALVMGKMQRLSFAIDKNFLLSILKRTYPFALLGVLMSIYNRLDSVMIERLLGDKGASEAGIYAAAYRLLDAVNMFGFLFATLLLPIFARMLREKEHIQELLQTSYRLIFVLAATVAGVCLIFRNEIMQLLYHEATQYWGTIFGLLIVSFIFIASIYIFGTLLTAAERMKHLNIIALFGVILNIVLNYVLINQYQALGATIATFITQGLVMILHLIAAYRIFQLTINSRLIALLITYFAVTLLTAYFMKGFFDQWIGNFAIAVAFSLTIAGAMRLIEWQKLVVMIRSQDKD